LVKLVKDERGSAAMRECAVGARLVSSELVLTEVPRALRRNTAMRSSVDLATLLRQASEVLDEVTLQPIGRDTLLDAGALGEPTLRSLDAIHVVTAVDLWPIDAFVTYDERQAAAARLAGLPAVSPGA
jgi:uncharacterized protein